MELENRTSTNITIPSSFLFDSNVSSAAKLLYQVLTSSIDQETGGCWISAQSLAETLNWKEENIKKYLLELQDCNLINFMHSNVTNSFYSINPYDQISYENYKRKSNPRITKQSTSKNNESPILTKDEILALLKDDEY